MIKLLALILFLLPAYLLKFKIFGVPTTLLEILIYAALLVELVQIVFYHKKIKKIPKIWLIAIVLFIISAVISVLVSSDKTLSLGVLKGWIVDPIILFWLIYNNIKSQKDFKIILGSLVTSAAILSLIGLWQYFSHHTLTDDGRLSALFSSANYFAMYAGPILPLVVYLIFQVKKYKIIWIITTTIIFLAIALSFSYAAWIALFVCAIIAFLYLIKSKRKYWVLAILVILAGVIVSTQVNSAKFKQISNFSGRSSLKSRLEIWQVSWYLIKKHPTLGIGLGNFEKVYQENLAKVVWPPLEFSAPEPHNIFLAFWLNMGILGLIAFLFLVVLFFKNVSKQMKEDSPNLAFFLFLAMLMILIHGLLDTPYWKNDLAILFWLILGLMFVNNQNRQEGKKK